MQRSFLDTKAFRSTGIYITIERTIFEPSGDEFTVKVASKPEEIKSLLETGFEYVTDRNNYKIYRKRK